MRDQRDQIEGIIWIVVLLAFYAMVAMAVAHWADTLPPSRAELLGLVEGPK